MPMKKLFSKFPRKGLPAALWLLIHLGIPLLLLLSFIFAGPLHINTQLLEMLPRQGRSGVLQADRILGEKSGRQAIVLAAAEAFDDAKNGAVLLYSKFVNDGIVTSPAVETVSLYFDRETINGMAAYFYDYRFVIAGKKTLELLDDGRAGEIAEDALASAYGAFNFFPLDTIEKDPFLLAGRRMEEFLSSSIMPGGGSLGLKDDVLAARINEVWYVLLRLTLSPQALSVKEAAVREIYTAAALAKETVPGLEFYFSGLPFHSYESSSSAQKEISLISTLALVIVLILFLFVFRSPLPVLLSILAAFVSLGLATAAALLVFREIHVITFVFGTTLIGTCVDYSVHFFVHWKGNSALRGGDEIRSHISKSLIMSFISTEICFFVFFLAPFPILKQFAVFSMAGILSSFLTSFCLFPLLKIPAGKRFIFTPKFLTLRRPKGIVLIAAITVVCLAVILSRGIKIENDISSLYSMSDYMLESEKRAAQVLNYGSSGFYFIVSGSSPEETLQNEEILVLRLEEEMSRGNLGSFLGTSLFVPSLKRQKQTYEAMKALLPLAGPQYAALGFPPGYSETFYDEFASGWAYCFPENAPEDVGVSNLWIGNVGEDCYSCVMPLNPGDETLFRTIAGEYDFVHFINKVKDINSDLDTLTRTMVFFFLAAYLVISIIVFMVYPGRSSLKICAVPLFLVLFTLAVLAASNIKLGFFPAAGLILVFGLGLDYIFYMTSRKFEGDNDLTSLAVLLSFLTTLLSFGALGFSSFIPVHVFGITVSAGLGAAFISAMILQNREGGDGVAG